MKRISVEVSADCAVQVFRSSVTATGGVDWVMFCWFSGSDLSWMCEYVSLNEPLCCSPLRRRSQSPHWGTRLCEQLPAEAIWEKIYAAQLAVVHAGQNEGSHNNGVIFNNGLLSLVCKHQCVMDNPGLAGVVVLLHSNTSLLSSVYQKDRKHYQTIRLSQTPAPCCALFCHKTRQKKTFCYLYNWINK